MGRRWLLDPPRRRPGLRRGAGSRGGELAGDHRSARSRFPRRPRRPPRDPDRVVVCHGYRRRRRGPAAGLPDHVLQAGARTGSARAGFVDAARPADRGRPPGDRRHRRRRLPPRRAAAAFGGRARRMVRDRPRCLARGLDHSTRRHGSHRRSSAGCGDRHRTRARAPTGAAARPPRRRRLLPEGGRAGQRVRLCQLDPSRRHRPDRGRGRENRGHRTGLVRPRVGHLPARRRRRRLGLVQPPARRRPRSHGLPAAPRRRLGRSVLVGHARRRRWINLPTPPRRCRDRTPEWWTSPATGGRYPVGWRLRVPAHAIDLEITGLLQSSELDGSSTTGVIYWEGPVEVRGTAGGEGYAELTGYAGSLEGRF